LTITGSVGVILAAAERRLVGEPFAVLDELRARGGLWLPDSFPEPALCLAIQQLGATSNPDFGGYMRILVLLCGLGLGTTAYALDDAETLQILIAMDEWHALSSLLAWGLAQAGDCPQAGGRILVKTEPARAEVWVDGEKLADESPLVTPTLCPGTHEVKVKAEGYAVQTLAVEVPGDAGVTKTVALDVRTPGSTFRDPLADGIKGPEMVVIGAGGFLMGSPASEPERHTEEGPQHRWSLPSPSR
jgi:hypothetical protein